MTADRPCSIPNDPQHKRRSWLYIPQALALHAGFYANCTSLSLRCVQNSHESIPPLVSQVQILGLRWKFLTFSGCPTRLPPSPWSFASLRLKQYGISMLWNSASATAVATAIGIPLYAGPKMMSCSTFESTRAAAYSLPNTWSQPILEGSIPCRVSSVESHLKSLYYRRTRTFKWNLTKPTIMCYTASESWQAISATSHGLGMEPHLDEA